MNYNLRGQIKKEKMRIIYEDNHLLAINKPCRMLSQQDKTHDDSAVELVRDFIKQRDNKPGRVFATPVHRLDRPVSGVLLFAKTSKALTRMTALFRERNIEKEYLALSDKKVIMMNDIVETYLQKNKKTNLVESRQRSFDGAKKSTTEISWVGEVQKWSLYKIKPLTGRSHQIRAHMASINAPIGGDQKYGSSVAGKGKIYLHAYKLEFIHPVKKEPVLISTLPAEEGKWTLFTDIIEDL